MRVLSKQQQRKMIESGWTLKIKESGESNYGFEQRLLRYRYKTIKMYYTTTSVKGYHTIIAMVKN